MGQQKTIDFVDTYSAIYRREVFMQNGGFDTTFTGAAAEDIDLSFRLARKGCRSSGQSGRYIFLETYRTKPLLVAPDNWHKGTWVVAWVMMRFTGELTNDLLPYSSLGLPGIKRRDRAQ